MTKAKQTAPQKIVYRDPKTLKVDPRNARKHSAEQISQLRASYKEFGWTRPILLRPSGMIGAGHGAHAMALAEGVASVPTITLALTEKQWRAYAIIDNKSVLNSEWDFDILKTELGALQDIGFDLSITGFADLELGQIGVPGFELQERLDKADETPEPPKVPVVKRGELWILGAHRLVCGDSTNADDVARVISASAKEMLPLVTLMVTDPPYGVNYDPNWRNEADRANGKPYGASAIGLVTNDGESDWTEAWKLFPGDVVYCWHAGRHASSVQASLERAGFIIRSQIIWAKDRLIISRGDYHWKHEPCWYAVRKGKKGNWAGDRSQTTLWEISHAKSETGHGTQKPIEAMRRPILNNSKKGGAVYDPFLGSGTTLISCEMEGRRCFGLEIDPIYVETIIVRWESFSGKIALREDGKTLADLRKGKKK